MSYESFSSSRAPDHDQHYETGRQAIRSLPSYELNKQAGEIHIVDPIWGEEVIGHWPGDQVFLDLYCHPVFQRLVDIEQLTLPQRYATMPGSWDFSRWEHVWGSVVFVRKMIREAEEAGRTFSDEDKLHMQLRTLLSDAGHTAFSHLGDWLRQSFGGSEDSHDLDLGEFLEITGVNTILRGHGVEPEAVIFPPTEDFVECGSPDLCVDRVDYAAREIARWVDPGSEQVWQHAFAIDDKNRLVMRGKNVARYFALSFGLLATEHWSHPVHRLQLQLFGELIKGALLTDTPLGRGEDSMHMIDRMYATDADLLANTRRIGPLNSTLHAPMLDIARAQRRIFAWGREGVIDRFLSPSRNGYTSTDASFPRPLDSSNSWEAQYSGPQPYNIELIEIAPHRPIESQVPDHQSLPYALDMVLPALKPRAVDPLFVKEDGSIGRLSHEDTTFAGMLQEIKEMQRRTYLGRVIMAPQAVARTRKEIREVNTLWEQKMRAERTQASRLAVAGMIEEIGWLAVGNKGRSVNRT